MIKMGCGKFGGKEEKEGERWGEREKERKGDGEEEKRESEI